MKRVASIFLLLVVIFNLYGYRLVLSYMQESSTAVVEQKIEQNNYADSELLSVKTTLHLPYYSGSIAFERAYGSITVNGVDYEYVKRRVYNDTLELLCLPNHDKTKLQNVSNELAKSTADDNASLPLKKSATQKISLPDFCQSLREEASLPHKIINTVYQSSSIRFTSSDYSLQQEHPPQINA